MADLDPDRERQVLERATLLAAVQKMRAGFDRDPGYLPWAGRELTFAFEDEVL